MANDKRANPELANLHARAAELLTRIAVSNEPPSQRDRAMASIYASSLEKRHGPRRSERR